MPGTESRRSATRVVPDEEAPPTQIMRSMIKRFHDASGTQTAMADLSIDDVLQIVRDAGTKVDLEQLGPDADLTALGADSLDMMTVLLDVQDRTGVEIPDEDVDGLRSPRLIAEYVDRASGKD